MYPPATQSFGKGVFYMVVSAFWFALTYLFVKLCAGHFPFFLFAFLRFLIPALILLVVLLIERRLKACFRIKHFHTHLLRAFCVTIAQLSIFYYISRSSLLNATVLLNTGPLFIPLIEWLARGYPLKKKALLPLFIGFVGVILILQPGSDLFSWLSFVGLLAGFAQACSQVLYGVHSHQESPEVNIFLLFSLSTCISIVPLLISYFAFSFETARFAQVATAEHGLYLLFLLVVAIANVLTQFFRGLAYLRGGRPATLATFLYLAVLFAFFYDWIIFDHPANIYSLLGALFVMGSGLLRISLSKKNKLKHD